MASQANEKSIRIHVEMDDAIDQLVGFQLSIEELITNLLANAIKYSDSDSVVELKVRAGNKQVQFDTGSWYRDPFQ